MHQPTAYASKPNRAGTTTNRPMAVPCFLKHGLPRPQCRHPTCVVHWWLPFCCASCWERWRLMRWGEQQCGGTAPLCFRPSAAKRPGGCSRPKAAYKACLQCAWLS